MGRALLDRANERPGSHTKSIQKSPRLEDAELAVHVDKLQYHAYDIQHCREQQARLTTEARADRHGQWDTEETAGDP